MKLDKHLYGIHLFITATLYQLQTANMDYSMRPLSIKYTFKMKLKNYIRISMTWFGVALWPGWLNARRLR
jgi:hypothetical protein